MVLDLALLEIPLLKYRLELKVITQNLTRKVTIASSTLFDWKHAGGQNDAHYNNIIRI